MTGVFPQVRCYFSPVLSPVSPRCCGHFFVAPQQPPTNFRCYFLPFSYWFPVLPPLIRHFPRFLPQFSPVLPPVLRPACATARQRTSSTGGVPAFKPGPHVHPILETVLTASYLPIFPALPQPQPPTDFRCYFSPFSYWFPVLPPLIRHFPRFLSQFSPVFRRFSALRVLLRDNVHPHLEACLLSSPDHTCIQSWRPF